MLATAGRSRGLAPRRRVYPANLRSRRTVSRRAALRAAGPALALVSLAACAATPVTGRQAFNVMSVEDDKALGAKAYSDEMSKVKLADNHPQAPMVREVVDRLVQVAQQDVSTQFDWEVHLIDAPEIVNAWCMPGGKMAVYTGILPVTKDATGLAVVMGHEIGHAVARHGTERISQQYGAEILLGYLAGDYANLAGPIAQLAVFMPWGRKQELEADHIGIIYMARAGYDPRQSVEFWQRMAAGSQGAPPEFLSTHPSDEKRIAQLQELMPEAMKEYQAATGKAGAESGKPKALKPK
jgi:metalloendopeptidase OMA1, mitochondrial